MLRPVRGRSIAAVRAFRRLQWVPFALALVALLACPGRGGPPTLPPPDPELVAANEALGDPYAGRFPLEEALAGLPEGGSLRAELHTSEGVIPCRLMPEHAPLAVASFVGLSRGLRPFKAEDGTWTKQPYYEGVPFHRAEDGQFVQTGRRGRMAEGGFFLQDEVGYGDSFDRPGVLAMANQGTEHSASVQFFVTSAAAPHLEGEHTILGECDGEAIVRRIERAVLGRRDPPPTLLRVEILRR